MDLSTTTFRIGMHPYSFEKQRHHQGHDRMAQTHAPLGRNVIFHLMTDRNWRRHPHTSEQSLLGDRQKPTLTRHEGPTSLLLLSPPRFAGIARTPASLGPENDSCSDAGPRFNEDVLESQNRALSPALRKPHRATTPIGDKTESE